MFGSAYKWLVVAMWLPLVTIALNYWRAWDRLPARMAVHFDANWQPNGYTSREGSLMLTLGMLAFMQVVFTISALIVRAQKPRAAWPMLVVFYLFLGLIWYANNWIVEFNLKAQPAHSELVGPISPAASDSVPTLLQPHS
ncbi:MAG TPA: DUF1648 domain-containing protein [Candidatus Sulfotelmatobacter sp.]|nr:DUF1648 domain-containing protein [Candidatus Sulfotelmatobacter sp.]